MPETPSTPDEPTAPASWSAPSEETRRPHSAPEPAASGAGTGVPPLPDEGPRPLSEQPAAPESGVAGGAHRAPASLDHAAYAGPSSSAFGNLSSQTGYTGADQQPSYDSRDATTAAWSAPADPQRRRGIGPFVAVAVVAAVIGGLVATGGYALLGDRGTTSTAVGPSGNLTVNDYNDATVVTAVAAKATQSVVTISVSAGTSAGTGSGVILSSDGYIVTNTHVVTLDGASSAGKVSVTTSNGRIFAGKVIGTDPLVDLAVIKVEATGLTPMTFADSSKLNVGDTAVAIGAPLGLSNTVTDGIVSTLNRSITVQSSAAPADPDSGSGSQQDNNGQGPFSFDNGSGSSSSTSATISLPVIQTDASINPGNSGGALLDSKGRLIGLNVAIASSGSSSGSIGVGFSIPSDLVKRVSTSIRETGSATHGLLGASVADATSDTTATQTGALIKSLVSGGAAQKAGLRAGDVVTKVNGVGVTDATDLTAQVRVLAGGAKATVEYVRDGSVVTSSVTLGTLKG